MTFVGMPISTHLALDLARILFMALIRVEMHKKWMKNDRCRKINKKKTWVNRIRRMRFINFFIYKESRTIRVIMFEHK